LMLLGALGGLETAMTALGLPHGDGLPAAVASLAATAQSGSLSAGDPSSDSGSQCCS